MRLHGLLLLLGALAGCGGPTPEALCADGACDRAFSRVVFVDVSSPGGSFRVLRDGKNERNDSNGTTRGVELTRDELAPLWLLADDPSLHAGLKAERARGCEDFRSRRCLMVSVASTFTQGCWCGPAQSAKVEAAWQQALAVFDRAFP